MAAGSAPDPVAVRLPRNYDVQLLQRDLQALQDIQRAAQPGPYHKGGSCSHFISAARRTHQGPL